jgi:hydroxyisourate hydrolase
VIGLTTHVLDAVHGGGAGGVRVDLSRRDADGYRLVKHVTTRYDGRADVLDADELQVGDYELLFYVGDYFAARGLTETFLDTVPVWFTVADTQRHYHVPLVAGPAAFSTYRGGLPPAGGAVLPPEMQDHANGRA